MPAPGPTRERPDLLHRTFEACLLLKGLYAAVDLGTAALFWMVKPGTLGPWLHTLTANHLAEGPHDFIGTLIRHAGGRYSPDVQHFAIVYLLCHGLLKLGLVIILLSGKTWSYPVAIGLLALFVTYLGIRWTHTHGILLVPLASLDLLMMWAVLGEYRRLRAHAVR